MEMEKTGIDVALKFLKVVIVLGIIGIIGQLLLFFLTY